jgi:hypothetical protein
MWKWIRTMPPMSKASLAAGVGALCAAAAMNIVFGQTLAATDRGQVIYSVASFVCAVAGTVVFGMMLGRLLREKRWAAAVVPALLLCLATLWDIVSVMGFNATERLSAVAYRQEAIAMAKDEAALRKRYAEKLMGVATIRGTGISKTERKEFMATASSEIGKVGSMTAGPKLLPDALAELLSRYSGRSVEDIQLTLIVYMSILLILIQSAGFTYTTYFDDREAASVPKDDAGSSSGSGGKRHLRKVHDADASVNKSASSDLVAKPASVPQVNLRSGVGVISTDAPHGKLSPDQLLETVRQDLARGQSSSSYALAAATGWSQSKVNRLQRRLRSQQAASVRRFAGNGGGMHPSAAG